MMPLAQTRRTLRPLTLLAGFHFFMGCLGFLEPRAVLLPLLASLLAALVSYAGSTVQPQLLAFQACSYAIGAEVWLRMARIDLPWEGAKYAVLLIGVVLLLHLRPFIRPKPLLLLLLLFPSLLVHCPDARHLRFLYLGPLSAGIWLSIKWRPREGEALPWLKVLPFYLLPLWGMLGLSAMGVIYGLLHWPQDLQGTELFRWIYSLRFASFSFGPNQVGMHYSLAVLVCAWGYEKERRTIWLLAEGLFLLACAACFSRLPFWLALAVPLLHLGKGARLFIPLSMVALAGLLFGPALLQRMTALHAPMRLANAWTDWQLFLEHPLLGVGPGGGLAARAGASGAALSHAEPLRLLSEHGTAGLVLLLFSLVGLLRCLRRPEPWKILAALWILAYLFHSATRTLAPLLPALLLLSGCPDQARVSPKDQGSGQA